MNSSIFDDALAEYPVRRVDVRRIIDLLPVTHAPERIEQYRQAMLAGERFPPISVLSIGRYFIIADGHKRFQAYRQLADKQMLVEVWTIPRWLRDQYQQLARRSRWQWDLLKRSPFEAQARREGLLLIKSTLRHWRRLVLSLFTLARNGWRRLFH